jgi:phosphotransferase system IIA component
MDQKQPVKAVDMHMIHIGIIQTLMQEFEQHRLPRLFRLKDKVDNGEAINDVDLEYLCKEIKDAGLAMHMTVNYPELQNFCFQMAHLYKEICDEALENEKR